MKCQYHARVELWDNRCVACEAHDLLRVPHPSGATILIAASGEIVDDIKEWCSDATGSAAELLLRMIDADPTGDDLMRWWAWEHLPVSMRQSVKVTICAWCVGPNVPVKITTLRGTQATYERTIVSHDMCDACLQKQGADEIERAVTRRGVDRV